MTYIVYITGDTYRFRDIFRASENYRWDASSKSWVREYDEPITDEAAIAHVRQLPGIRNRGKFSAEVK